MNFLSHYYILYERQEPLFSLGKVFPDLLRNFHKKGKIAAMPHMIPVDDELRVLKEGIENHLLVDKIFHQTDYFTEKTEVIKTILKEERYDTIKKYFYFYAHILLELMLDRLLLKYDRNIGVSFYEQLRQVEEVTIARYFRYNGIDLPVKEFFKFYQGFISHGYLFEYIHNERLIFALGRINYKVGLYDFSVADIQKLNARIEKIEAALEKDFLHIFKEIEKQIT